jgi:hypothetical protein
VRRFVHIVVPSIFLIAAFPWLSMSENEVDMEAGTGLQNAVGNVQIEIR